MLLVSVWGVAGIGGVAGVPLWSSDGGRREAGGSRHRSQWPLGKGGVRESFVIIGL